MRMCVLGGGLAGSLLGWRLAAAGVAVDLWSPPGTADATAASGGLVRAFEPDPTLFRLATESLAELAADPDLRRAAGYRRTGSVYLLRADRVTPAVAARLAAAGPDGPRPGPAALLTGSPLRCADDDVVAVREREAGYLSPDALRRYAHTLVARHGGTVVPAAAVAVEPGRDGVTVHGPAARRHRYDLVVLAAGPWTGSVLARSGLDPQPLRTKLIQYQVHPCAGPRPPAFVDETTGLYGRPYSPGAVLLGVPSRHWDVDPAARRPVPELVAETVRAARLRLPGLDLGRPHRTVVAVDGYAPAPYLSLRTVPGTEDRLRTFAGGSGGAAKLALAATAHAARSLLAGTPTRAEPRRRPALPDAGLSTEGT
ncbi:FAD-dependent oxidoreductase [Micromonospora rosaria]|nr:FAD-dependent oxidoreductase [Micromonospora rosaria]